MRAIVQDRYGPAGDVLQLREAGRPQVGDDEVLVRVRAASLHPDVWHVVTGYPLILRLMGPGLRKPKDPIPGTDFSGIVEDVGKNVRGLRPGDEVFGESRRGMGWRNGGTFAEYVSVPAEIVALKPPNISFEQAAAVPTAGIIAVHNLQYGRRLKAGQHVLVNGAAGGVGSIAVQLAKAHGARVTGVDGGEKLDVVRSLGADEVIDYTREDFTRRGERYDLIFDVASTLSLSGVRRALTPSGSYVIIGHDHYGRRSGRVLGILPRIFGLIGLSPFISQLPPPDFSLPNQREAMALLRELLEAGKLRPIIDRTYPLEEVPQAIGYLQEGQARGRIVITP